jgi:hypothetical protein
MIEMPVGIDEVPGRITADCVQSGGNLPLRRRISRLDQDLSVAARQNDDIAAHSGKHAKVAPQRESSDLCRASIASDVGNIGDTLS